MPRVCEIMTSHHVWDIRIFYRYAKSLSDAGFDVHAMLFGQSEQKSFKGATLHFVGTSRDPKERIPYMPEMLRKAIALDADIYHIHDPDFLPYALILKALKPRSAVVYDSHEDYASYAYHKEWIPDALKPAAAVLADVIEGGSSMFLDAVITADRGVAAKFRHVARDVVVVHNFPVREFVDALRPDAIPYEKREFDVIYHGSLPWAYAELLLDSAEILKRNGVAAKFLVHTHVHDIKPAFRDWITSQISQRGLDDLFIIRSRVMLEEIPQVLQNVRMGLIPLPDDPKYYKNVPQKMFEFMAAAMPLVVSDLPPVRDFVMGKGCAYLAKPGDANEFAEGVATLVNNPNLARKMGARGRKLVLDNYLWEDEFRNKVLPLFDRLLAKKHKK